MKILLVFWLIVMVQFYPLAAQDTAFQSEHRQKIQHLIAQYKQARETKDTLLLQNILIEDMDQLVSTGEWRRGKQESLAGMMRSSSRNPGSRTLQIEQIRFLDKHNALVDARYEIQNATGTGRKMWSTFVVVYENNGWKISAIRNMLPSQ